MGGGDLSINFWPLILLGVSSPFLLISRVLHWIPTKSLSFLWRHRNKPFTLCQP